jgi:hypothetical protein
MGGVVMCWGFGRVKEWMFKLGMVDLRGMGEYGGCFLRRRGLEKG